jgi:hypothetical protein
LAAGREPPLRIRPSRPCIALNSDQHLPYDTLEKCILFLGLSREKISAITKQITGLYVTAMTWRSR